MFPTRLFIAACFLAASALPAEELRALKPGQTLQDHRLQPLKDLSGYFPFTPPATAEAWSKRADALRMQMRVSLGLWPAPSKTPLEPVIHGRIDQGDYTVEKVFFQSMPGFFVTGNLYRPKGEGVHPGILSPHGHCKDGRFVRYNDQEVQEAYASGAERMESAARSHQQARCVHLARMGCVVFHYDMIGKADCVQISDEIAHGFKKQRPEINSPEGWGFYSPQAEMWSQNIMGLQTWNSIRALDFLTSLDDVDGARIGVTGESGGATQTMMLAALDERVTAAFPAVMVSTAMQGGCTCENACGLRVGTGNVEIASLFAPKPMAMTCANDWTKEMETKGFPEMQKLWALLGKPENVALTVGTQFPHNYNAPSRAAMYAWFNQHLGLKLPAERLEERDFPLLSREQMTVWDAAHPAPEGGPEFEKRLLRQWRDDVKATMGEGWNFLGYAVSGGWGNITDRRGYAAGDVSWHLAQKKDRGSYWHMSGVIRNDTFQEEIPAVFLHPKKWSGAMVLWLSELGKQALVAGEKAEPIPEVMRLLTAGVGVIGIDLVRQGEALPTGEDATRAPVVQNPREAAAYTLGYNRTVFAERLHDVMTVSQLVKTDQHGARALGVVALGKTAALASANLTFGHDIVTNTLVDDSFRFAAVRDLRDPYLVPGALRYGDLPGLLFTQGGERLRKLDGSKPRDEEIEAGLQWLIDSLQKRVQEGGR